MKNLLTKFLAIFLSFCLLSMQTTPLAAQSVNWSNAGAAKTADQAKEMYLSIKAQMEQDEQSEEDRTDEDDIEDKYKNGWKEGYDEECKGRNLDEATQEACRQLKNDQKAINAGYDKDVPNTDAEGYFALSSNLLRYLQTDNETVTSHLKYNEGGRTVSPTGYTDVLPLFAMSGLVDEQTLDNLVEILQHTIDEKVSNCESGKQSSCPLQEALALATLKEGTVGAKGLAQVFYHGNNHEKLAVSVVTTAGEGLLGIARQQKNDKVYGLFSEKLQDLLQKSSADDYRFGWDNWDKFIPCIFNLTDWLTQLSIDLSGSPVLKGVFLAGGFENSIYGQEAEKIGKTEIEKNNLNVWVDLGQYLGYLAKKEGGTAAKIVQTILKNSITTRVSLHDGNQPRDVVKNAPLILGILAQGILLDGDVKKTKDLVHRIYNCGMGDLEAKDRVYMREGIYEVYKSLGGDPIKDFEINSMHATDQGELQRAYDFLVLQLKIDQGKNFLQMLGMLGDLILAYFFGGIWVMLLFIVLGLVIEALVAADVIGPGLGKGIMHGVLLVAMICGGAKSVKGLRKLPTEQLKAVKFSWLNPQEKVYSMAIRAVRAGRTSFFKTKAGQAFKASRMNKALILGKNQFKSRLQELAGKIKAERPEPKPNNSGNRINGQPTESVPDPKDPHHRVLDKAPEPKRPDADYDIRAERIAQEARDAKVRETQAALEKEGWYKDLPSKQQNAVKEKLAELENESWYSDLPVKEKTAISKKMAELENEGWYQKLPAKQQARVAQSMNELEGEGWFSSLPEEGKTAIGEKMSQYSTPEQQKAAAYLERIKQHDGEGRLGGSPEKNAEWLKSVEDAIASDKWSASDTSNLKGVVDRLNNIDSEVNVAEGDYGKLVFDGKYTPGKAPSSTLLIENMPKGRLLRAINERLSSRGMEINNDGVLEGIKSPEDLQFAMRVIEEQTGGKVRFTLHESGSLRRRTTVQMEINDRLAEKKMMLEEDGKAVKGVNNDADLAEAVRIIEEETGSKVTLIPDSSKKGRYLVKIDGKDGLPEFVHNLTPVSYWTKTGADRIRLHIHYEVEVMENGRPVLRNYTIVLDVAELEIEGMKLGTLLDPKNISNNYYGHVELAKRTIKDAQKNPGYPDAKVAEKVQQGLDKAKELRDLLTKFRDAIYRAFSNGRTPDNMEGGLFEVEGMFENPLSGKTKEALEEFRKLRKTSPKPKDFDSWPEWLKERYEEPTFIDLLKEDINILTKEMGYYK